MPFLWFVCGRCVGSIVRPNANSSVQNHRFTYDESMGVEACTQAICDLALRFGEDRKGGAKEDIMVRGPH